MEVIALAGRQANSLRRSQACRCVGGGVRHSGVGGLHHRRFFEALGYISPQHGSGGSTIVGQLRQEIKHSNR